MQKRILYSGALFIGLVSVQSGFAQKKKSKTPYPSTANTLRTGKKEKKETWTAQYRQSVRLQSMRKMYTVLQVTSKRRDGNEV